MRIVNAEEVRMRLTMPICIGLMKEAFLMMESGQVAQPSRSVIHLPDGNIFVFMPSWMDDYFGAKIVSAFHSNTGTQFPSHMGYVMVFDSLHGEPLGMADATVITEIRTGAASGVATDLLARKDARTLAIIGCGTQGRSHLSAMTCVRNIAEVKCFDIVAERAQNYAAQMRECYGIPITAANTVEEAVKDADIVCTATLSQEAFLKAEWIRPGTHINAVGAYTPVTREVTSELVAKSKLYADQVESMEKETGEFLIPLQEGLITEEHIVGSIGGVLSGKAPGRVTEKEITLFKALGMAAEDLMCGKYLICN